MDYEEFLKNCLAGNIDKVRAALESGQDCTGPPEGTETAEFDGRTPLMAAASGGNKELVTLLLEHGAPWNATDKKGRCAGDYAVEAGHQEVVDLLVSFGCQAELMLGLLEKRQLQQASETGNAEYLKQKLTFDTDKVLDEQGDAVMMEWERPLMEAHAEFICSQGGDILNVGFGMGLIDEAIQRRSETTRNITSHTIIEAHPDVFAKMISDGWDKKPGVTVLYGRWQEVLPQLSSYDGIFFDTYGEHYYDLSEFQSHLPRILKRGGVYSFFNGLSPDNEFFHGVACEIVRLELRSLGMESQFLPLPAEAARGDSVWRGTARRYFHSSTYHLPVAYFADEAAAPDDPAGAA